VSYLSASAKIRRAVFERANGACECCGAHVGFSGELGHWDHFWGRAKVAESLESTWGLCVSCDADKTHSRPSARWWIARFSEHCGAFGYHAECDRADNRLAVLAQKFPIS
jgi:hypothetical protein